MKSSRISAMTCRASSTYVGENQTPGPKLQYPCSSGGETDTRKTSGRCGKAGGNDRAVHLVTGKYSTLPALTCSRSVSVAKKVDRESPAGSSWNHGNKA